MASSHFRCNLRLVGDRLQTDDSVTLCLRFMRLQTHSVASYFMHGLPLAKHETPIVEISTLEIATTLSKIFV